MNDHPAHFTRHPCHGRCSVVKSQTAKLPQCPLNPVFGPVSSHVDTLTIFNLNINLTRANNEKAMAKYGQKSYSSKSKQQAAKAINKRSGGCIGKHLKMGHDMAKARKMCMKGSK